MLLSIIWNCFRGHPSPFFTHKAIIDLFSLLNKDSRFLNVKLSTVSNDDIIIVLNFTSKTFPFFLEPYTNVIYNELTKLKYFLILKVFIFLRVLIDASFVAFPNGMENSTHINFQVLIISSSLLVLIQKTYLVWVECIYSVKFLLILGICLI